MLNASISLRYCNITSNNYRRKLGLRQPVPEGYSQNTLHLWKLQPKTRLRGWQIWLLTSDFNFRTVYLMLGPKPQRGASLIPSPSRSSWRERCRASPSMNRYGSRTNSPSAWSSLKLCGRQSAFRHSRKPSDRALSISDIQWCIMWVIYHSQFAEWVLVTISPLIFLNSDISPMWKRQIDLGIKSITFDRCLCITTSIPVLTIWSRYCHILHSKAGTMLTLQQFSTDCPLRIYGKVHT